MVPYDLAIRSGQLKQGGNGMRIKKNCIIKEKNPCGVYLWCIYKNYCLIDFVHNLADAKKIYPKIQVVK